MLCKVNAQIRCDINDLGIEIRQRFFDEIQAWSSTFEKKLQKWRKNANYNKIFCFLIYSRKKFPYSQLQKESISFTPWSFSGILDIMPIICTIYLINNPRWEGQFRFGILLWPFIRIIVDWPLIIRRIVNRSLIVGGIVNRPLIV